MSDVDEQSKRLVKLVKQLGRDVDGGSDERIDATQKALADDIPITFCVGLAH